jgi:hypothetical protein
MGTHERQQVAALTRAFLARFFENEITSGTDDLKTSFFWLLSFLAVPGFFMPMTMAFSWQLLAMIKGPEVLREMTRGDKAFYLGFVMVATAAITAIAWNSLLTDRRDGLVLGVLPVRPAVVVIARLLALALYMLLVAIAMNAIASVSFGLFLSAGSSFPFMLRGVAAHFLASVGVSTSVFLSIAGLQGVVLAVCGPRAFTRIAPLLQLALVGLVVAGFLVLPLIDVSVVDTLADRGHHSQRWLLLTPPLWFLGAYEVVLGTSDPSFHVLARRAVLLGITGLATTVCSYPIAYRRVMTAVVQDNASGARASITRTAAHVVTRVIGRASDIRGVSQFLLTTVGRVERHRFVVAAAAGVVVAWALPGWLAMMSSRPPQPRIGLLSLPLAAMVFLVTGVRVAVSLPADLKAGWVFEVCPPRHGRARATVERTMIAFCILPVALMCAPLYATLWGWNIALSHMAISIAMGVCLVELALWRFHAVPCAKPWNPEGANLSRLWWAYLIGFVLFTVTVPSYELRAFDSTTQVAVFTGVGFICAGVLRVLSLRWRVVETDESAFAPGDILSLN